MTRRNFGKEPDWESADDMVRRIEARDDNMRRVMVRSRGVGAGAE